MCAEEHKAAPAEIARGGMNDCKSKARGYGGINGVTALAQDFKAGVGGKMLDADDHSILGSDRLLVQIGNHVLWGLLDRGLSWGEERL